eukprot:SAG31_NODE_1537_length_7982_cov_2.277813_12_plen_84_part_00
MLMFMASKVHFSRNIITSHKYGGSKNSRKTPTAEQDQKTAVWCIFVPFSHNYNHALHTMLVSQHWVLGPKTVLFDPIVGCGGI